LELLTLLFAILETC
jgi:ubiquitin-conjugating enzyme E2 variant